MIGVSEAVEQFGFDAMMTHVSTGGGAFLAYVEKAVPEPGANRLGRTPSRLPIDAKLTELPATRPRSRTARRRIDSVCPEHARPVRRTAARPGGPMLGLPAGLDVSR